MFCKIESGQKKEDLGRFFEKFGTCTFPDVGFFKDDTKIFVFYGVILTYKHKFTTIQLFKLRRVLYLNKPSNALQHLLEQS